MLAGHRPALRQTIPRPDHEAAQHRDRTARPPRSDSAFVSVIDLNLPRERDYSSLRSRPAVKVFRVGCAILSEPCRRRRLRSSVRAEPGLTYSEVRQCPTERPGPRATGRQLPPGKAINYYRPTGSAEVRAAHRRRLPGLQRRTPVGGLPHLRRQDAGPGERHHHRPDRRRRADAGRPRRLRHRADGPRPDRLHDQHRRESLSRPPLRAELHAPPRLAVPRRRRALRAGHHPHLRRPVPGDGAARDRRLHPRLPGPLGPRRARCRPPSSTTGSGSTCSSATRLRGVLGRRPGRAVRRADLHLVARRQFYRHEHRVPRADERRHADDRPEQGRQRGLRDHPRRATRTAASSSAADRRRTSTCRGSRRSGRSTASPRAATTTSSRSPPTRSSGAACRARRPPRRSAGARSTRACCPTPSSPTATRRSPFRCSASTPSARSTTAARARSWSTSATRWSPTWCGRRKARSDHEDGEAGIDRTEPSRRWSIAIR